MTLLEDRPSASEVPVVDEVPLDGVLVTGEPGDAAVESDAAIDADADEYVEPPLPPLRVGLVVGASTVAAGVVVGSIFEGIAGTAVPVLAGICGVGVAAQAARRKRALAVNLTIGLGLLAIGLLVGVLPTGFDNLTRLGSLLREAGAARKVQRPPAEFLPGFRAIAAWLMAFVGFTAGWLGIELRRPSLGLLAPLPVLIVAAISVPDSAKLPVGVVVLVLFLAGLTFLSSVQQPGAEGEKTSFGYEARRFAKIIPLVAVLCGALVLLARSNLLFPPPLYDPVRDSQRPKAIPLSEVEDKVLFQVKSRSTGPWRIGLLDVYVDGEWRIPAFAETELKGVPRDGRVDRDLGPATRAEFLVKGLGGAVLPGLPNTVGIVAEGPRLGYDPRTGAIRLVEGQIRTGLAYVVSGAALPTEEQLQRVTFQLPNDPKRFLAMPDPPPAVAQLLAEAPAQPMWERLEFVRRRLLETVTAAGPGTPVPVPPSKVDDMLAGSKEGSPFEIVAAQAMLARWAGVPARIGYGYDGGDIVGDGLLEVRPKHGASWLEVYFPGFKWFPLIGAPLKAKPNLNAEGPTNQNERVEASDDIAVEVFIPLRIEQSNLFYDQVRKVVVLLIPVVLLVLLVYFTLPAVRKALRRARRRRWANAAGPLARVEVAYSEFRDMCIDLGIGSEHAPPLVFLDRFVDDADHTELAWLVTRCLYGDLRDDVGEDEALAAEELSRTLRRRLMRAQPPSLRFVAAVSRLSIAHPYAPEVRGPSWKERRHARAAA